jgi:hypothetical protein
MYMFIFIINLIIYIYTHIFNLLSTYLYMYMYMRMDIYINTNIYICIYINTYIGFTLRQATLDWRTDHLELKANLSVLGDTLSKEFAGPEKIRYVYIHVYMYKISKY